MNHSKLENPFLLILLVGVIILSFFIFKPFLYAVILAAAFAVVFQPVYRKLLNFFNQRKALASSLTTAAIFFLIFTPLILLVIQITREAAVLYRKITQGGTSDALIAKVNELIANFFPNFAIDINQYTQQALNWLLPNLTSLFSNSAMIAMSAFVFFFTLYYIFKDGHSIKSTIVAMSPLADVDDEMLLKKLGSAINAVLKGNLMIAIIKGIIMTIGFWIFGVPNATLWGSVGAVTALIPGIGTALVLVPAIAYLFVTEEFFLAIGLLVWGVIAVGTIDNILGPILMGRGTELHPLFIFLSVIGGIAFFGPIGILLGPIVISLLISLLSIYSLKMKNHSHS